ncbi:MAG: CCA tRNA nucleotidyltransferase [Thermoplasmata archaeon]|nr:MAG: CCA tRNA nucleotidyltransferase [Thermoplasmata archaeon]
MRKSGKRFLNRACVWKQEMKVEEILDIVIERVKPTHAEDKKIRKVVDDVIRKIRIQAEKIGVDVKPMLVGSVAKGTHLKNTDIDIFLLFPERYERGEIEKYGLMLAKKVMKGEERYAEHPYLRGVIDGYEVDIVPAYMVANGRAARTAVDRTPHHTEYVRKNLPENLKNDVRVLKQFMKGVGVYGAEAKVGGFSGYLCELLVLYYGGFMDVLNSASKWKPRVIISIDGKKFEGVDKNSPMLVIDPTDSRRNVAAAVTMDKFALFIHASREFLKNPSLNFFFPPIKKALKAESVAEIIKRRGTYFFAIIVDKPKVVDDVLYPQVQKALRAFEKCIRESALGLIRSAYFVSDRIIFIFECERGVLPMVEKHRGPPVWSSHAENFRRKWEGNERALSPVYIEGGRYYVDIKRRETTALEVMKKCIVEKNLGQDLGKNFTMGYEFVQGDELLRFCQELGTFLSYKFPWEE